MVHVVVLRNTRLVHTSLASQPYFSGCACALGRGEGEGRTRMRTRKNTAVRMSVDQQEKEGKKANRAEGREYDIIIIIIFTSRILSIMGRP